MENSKNPLPEEMDHIDGNRRGNNNNVDNLDSSNQDEQDNQLVDLDNPMLHTIDNDDVIDNSAGFNNSEVGSDAIQGLTPAHRQNIDESRVDEILVQDNIDDSDYPDAMDIVDREAAERSNDDDF
ncbi:hypothetical protein QL898_01740 [Psychrobacter sp. APC 3279]|uniref:hypothetical protein n=1 Tax=Psychrobacter sp. APC 3279 TaxID=3035189 RepID=UPI0025B31512|nr:hypothetical protein [Psychrobacter sp. APC 3279]MDN3440348.1 hypothetical protein [Psychrobacter sp. APC 3279]